MTITVPPMVGVPRLVACPAGPSSRIACPYPRRENTRIASGVPNSATSSEIVLATRMVFTALPPRWHLRRTASAIGGFVSPQALVQSCNPVQGGMRESGARVRGDFFFSLREDRRGEGRAMRKQGLILGCLVLGDSLVGPVQAAAAQSGKVVVIVMENEIYDDIIGSSQAPYLNQLIPQGDLFTDYAAVASGSNPNYLAMTSGLTSALSPPSANIGSPDLTGKAADPPAGTTAPGYGL